jgi:hypothetical protein
VTLEGFKTGVYNDVILNAGIPTAINARLEVGGLAETVTVEGATALVQTVSSAVSSTINTQQIERMPLPSRNVLDFVTRLPGVETSGGLRQSTISGLPRSAINITLDGINVQDNTLRTTDGFFTIVQPRLDAIEEVTVSMAAGEAVGGGQGAVQIRFTTRSGTNTYSGSLYHYYRNDALNENTWFNKRERRRQALAAPAPARRPLRRARSASRACSTAAARRSSSSTSRTSTSRRTSPATGRSSTSGRARASSATTSAAASSGR